MKVCLSFSQTVDGRFLVLAAPGGAFSRGPESCFEVVTYDHEDTFLRLVIEAALDSDDTSRLVATVLLTVSQPIFPQRWVEVEISQTQSDALRLHDTAKQQAAKNLVVTDASPVDASFGFTVDARQFHDFLMEAPTPFVMLSGPLHRFTFINPPYVRLLSRTPYSEILGRPVRDVLPELEGHPFFGLLDEVYRTGIPYVGHEMLGRMRRGNSNSFEDKYFDFIYHPVRNNVGEVVGIMVQATDVTERVLAREVSEQREQQLYSQWAELDAIYRTSPVGIALVDATSLRLLRINERQAELMGAPVDDLIGKSVVEVAASIPRFVELVQRVVAGENIREAIVEVEQESPSSPAGRQSWMVNVTPALGASGEITAVSTIFVEAPASN